MKQARDLFLLAAIAYRQGKPADSGRLFAAAMASDDVEDFLTVLNEEQTVKEHTLRSHSSEVEDCLETAVSAFSESLSAAAEDEDLFEIGDTATEDDDTDFEDDSQQSDDPSDIMPGQNILPGSLSADPNKVDQPIPVRKSRIVISSSLNSPVRPRS